MLEWSLSLFAACNSTFLAFPNWYRGLPGSDVCEPRIEALGNVWIVVANVVDMALRLSGLIAIGFIIYGGISYIISQGNPDNIARAKDTIVNAIVGLVIAISSSALVSFIASRLS